MHAGGEFAPWDGEVIHAAIYAIGLAYPDMQNFIASVREWIKRKITAEIVEFISGCPVPDEQVGSLRRRDLGAWLFKQNLQPANRFLHASIQLELPIIGIGAPAGYFLPQVARALGTRLILPEHYEVANAVGTVVAEVSVRHEAEVTPVVQGTTIVGYAARAAGRRQEFQTQEEALVYAREAIRRKAAEEAAWAGAVEPQVELIEEEQAAGIVRLRVIASGKPE
jgi:N-methylhydantoinase A/oxoprolinase/acetone carboxylase beta subunit